MDHLPSPGPTAMDRNYDGGRATILGLHQSPKNRLWRRDGSPGKSGCKLELKVAGRLRGGYHRVYLPPTNTAPRLNRLEDTYMPWLVLCLIPSLFENTHFVCLLLKKLIWLKCASSYWVTYKFWNTNNSTQNRVCGRALTASCSQRYQSTVCWRIGKLLS